MTAINVTQPYTVFNDTDGTPLENGYIYIGEEGLLPEDNPINVYWDADFTQPAGQPIRTIGGYPSNNGRAGNLYVQSDYSIKVLNKNEVQVFYSTSQTGVQVQIDCVIPFNTVAHMVADTTLVEGQKCRTLGYYAVGDGGGNEYEIEAAGGSYDGGSAIFLSGSGLQATGLFLAGGVNVKQFGAKGDDATDDTLFIQAAIDYVDGDILFPEGIYRVARNIGVNDRWGLNIANSNIKISGDNASLRRYDTDISTYALSYPIILIGTPDSNAADATENIEITGMTFIGEDTRHAISGGDPSDHRCAIECKNTNKVKIYLNRFTKIDSQAICTQYPVLFDYANSVYYNTTKNYNLDIFGNDFIAESHAVNGRALIHAVSVQGVDRLNCHGNYFEWCDDAISSETTYDAIDSKELDIYLPTVAGWTLGSVKRSGRFHKFVGNECYNSSEHAIYLASMDVIASDNNIFADSGTIVANSVPIKIRAKNSTVQGNNVVGYGAGISISEVAQNINIRGNNINIPSSTTSSAGAIDIDSIGLSTYINNRSDYLTSYRQMQCISIIGNTIEFPQSAAASSENHVAIRISTDSSDANYPEGQLDGITISGNTVKNHNVGVYIISSLYRNCNIVGNTFSAKPFTSSGFTSGTTLNTRTVLQAKTSGAGSAKLALYYCTFKNNYIHGSEYLFCTSDGLGGSGYYAAEGCSGNKFNYIKNIKTSDVRAPDKMSMFQNNEGIYFLDRTWGGSSIENSFDINENRGNEARRYTFQFDGSNLRFYTDDSGTFLTL